MANCITINIMANSHMANCVTILWLIAIWLIVIVIVIQDGNGPGCLANETNAQRHFVEEGQLICFLSQIAMNPIDAWHLNLFSQFTVAHLNTQVKEGTTRSSYPSLCARNWTVLLLLLLKRFGFMFLNYKKVDITSNRDYLYFQVKIRLSVFANRDFCSTCCDLMCWRSDETK